MSDRKSLNIPINSNHQGPILQNRRMDEVKKNFAIRIQRVAAAKNLTGGLHINTRKN